MRLLPLLLLLAALPARANMASPVEPGTPAGEPAAALAGLRVARETLTLDLRPLGLGRPYALVEAEYRIVNRGDGRIVPLEFLALGDDVRAAEVWLDGQPVAATPIDSLRVPALWRVATTTPALDGDAVPYEAEDGVGAPRGLRFEVALPTGQHTVRVRYRVRPGSYDGGAHPNRVWQLAYSLAPARLWAGFGQLDVAVLVPEGWESAASLPLRDDGRQLVGRFPGVPGDVLAVSARAPIPAMRLPLRIAGFVVPLLVVGFFGWISGRLAARAGRSAWAALPGSILGGVLGAAAFFGLTATAHDLGDSSAFGYGRMIGLLFVGAPLALLLGTALAQAVAVRTMPRRRSQSRAPRVRG